MSINNIDKKDFFDEPEAETFADQFDRAFHDSPKEDLEKVFMENIPEFPDELGNDAYKDVLSSLSELDATGHVSIDYLEANRTRTLNLQKSSDSKAPSDSVSPPPKNYSFSKMLAALWRKIKPH